MQDILCGKMKAMGGQEIKVIGGIWDPKKHRTLSLKLKKVPMRGIMKSTMTAGFLTLLGVNLYRKCFAECCLSLHFKH